MIEQSNFIFPCQTPCKAGSRKIKINWLLAKILPSKAAPKDRESEKN